MLGLYNGLIKYFYQINVDPYIIENDIIIIGLFYIVSWLVGSVFDVERKTRNKLHTTRGELMENNALREDIIRFMPLGVLVIDTDEKIVHINQAAIDIDGILDKKPADYVGSPFSNYYNQLSDSLSLHKSLILKILDQEQSFIWKKSR